MLWPSQTVTPQPKVGGDVGKAFEKAKKDASEEFARDVDRLDTEWQGMTNLPIATLVDLKRLRDRTLKDVKDLRKATLP